MQKRHVLFRVLVRVRVSIHEVIGYPVLTKKTSLVPRPSRKNGKNMGAAGFFNFFLCINLYTLTLQVIFPDKIIELSTRWYKVLQILTWFGETKISFAHNEYYAKQKILFIPSSRDVTLLTFFYWKEFGPAYSIYAMMEM